MLRTVLAHLRAQWAGFLALFLVLAGGVAYAANTVFSTDIVNGEVKSVDIGTGQVQSADVKNEGLTGADIANQSGVDTCISSVRIGQLCFRAENFARPWNEALFHCANLDMRLPSLGEALELAQTHDLPNVDQGEYFWTEETTSPTADTYVVNDSGVVASATHADSEETACVTTPTN